MTTQQIQSTSMADLRAAYIQGKLSYAEVEQERLRRLKEQADIRANELELYGRKKHPQRGECCPIKFAEGLPKAYNWS